MSKMYRVIRNLYRAHKITCDEVWEYVDTIPPKITETEAVLICGPRKKDTYENQMG